MKLREAKFTNSVENGGSDTTWLQSHKPGDARTYAPDLRYEDGFVRWGGDLAPVANVKQMRAEPAMEATEPPKLVAVPGPAKGKKR